MHARDAHLVLIAALTPLLLLPGARAQDAPCYWPDHSPALNQTPCHALAAVSWCCFATDACLSNGLCLQQSAVWTNRVGRGACTDSTWSSAACPQYCADVTPDGSTTVFLAYDTPSGAFCCGENYDAASSECALATRGSRQPFDISAGEVVYNRTDGALLLPNPANTAQPTVGVFVSLATITVTATATATGSAAAGVAKSTNTGLVTQVAAGIAVPLGILLLAALAAIAVLVSRNRKLRQAHESQSWASPDPKSSPMEASQAHSSVYEPPKSSQQQWPRAVEAPAYHEVAESDSRPVATTRELPGV
ncbi:hypothetical protein LTR53_004917 [Teratosphaeriaceae sp. CCFEE 6253]|nr:hypothetical protein LTR53_004917 [Teratosphaeriaceae sp. CCFEE 6253]